MFHNSSLFINIKIADKITKTDFEINVLSEKQKALN